MASLSAQSPISMSQSTFSPVIALTPEMCHFASSALPVSQAAKAIDETAYVAMCSSFAGHLMEKYPHLQYLNREDDLGIEGLRKSKLAYNPVTMIEKHWACLKEAGCEY